MDIEKLRRLKKQAEAKLTNEIGNILLQFEQETGEYPESINLEIVKIQNFGEPDQNVLLQAEIEIKV